MKKLWQNSATNRLEGNMLLAIDTSTQSIGLSLYNDSQVIAEEIWQAH